MSALADFHFVRPLWLLALLPLALLIWQYHRQKQQQGLWSNVISPVFLKLLLEGEQSRESNLLPQALGIAWLLITLALAGPAWQKQPQPVQIKQDHLIVVLDLSLSMYATDLQPNRITRVQNKLRDLLALRTEGEMALVVYAGDAHAVAPLTDDSETIANLITSLDPFIMPALGSEPEQGIQMALDMFASSGVRGRILLVTDAITAADADAIQRLLQGSPHAFSLLAVGSEDGGPIPIPNRGFLKDGGDIVLPKADHALMQTLATQLGGRYSPLTLNNTDLNRLVPQSRLASDFEQGEDELESDQWQEAGHWLILLALPFALFVFRRHALLGVAALGLGLGLPPKAQAFDWNALWRNADQRAQQAYETEDYERAETLFNNERWRAAAQHKAGQYEAAADTLKALPEPQAADFYNLGNSLAQQQQFEEAIAAYEEALQLDANHQQASDNKALIEDWLQQQEAEQQQSEQGDGESESDGEQGQSDSSNQDPSGQNESQESSSSNNDDSNGNNGGNQNPPPSGGEPDAEDSSDTGQSNENGQQPPSQADEETTDEAESEAAQAGDTGDPSEQPPSQADATAGEQPPSEQEQAIEQWLRQVPDDPGNLLRNKFNLQYEERRRQGRVQESEQPW